MSRSAFAAVVIGSYLVGAAFLVGALLVFSGAVTVAGLGEGSVVQRIVAGFVALLLGGVTVAAATMKLAAGPVTRSQGRPAAGDSYGEVVSRSHPGVGEF